MKKLVLILMTVISLPALAADEKAKPAAPPPPPPEVKKTVDAFVGTWTIEGTVTGIPGMKDPLKVKETVDCKKAVSGLVASCTGKATSPMGPMEDIMLITWDQEAKAVRVVGMSSLPEVHDHKCAWKDDKNLTCDPLQLTWQGAPATVDMTMAWTDAKNVVMTESTTMKDGTKVVFEGKGKRK